jgi:hypothetical protein
MRASSKGNDARYNIIVRQINNAIYNSIRYLVHVIGQKCTVRVRIFGTHRRDQQKWSMFLRVGRLFLRDPTRIEDERVNFWLNYNVSHLDYCNCSKEIHTCFSRAS